MTRDPVQERWLKLAFSTMFSIAGLVWTMTRYADLAALGAYVLQVLGLLAGTGVAIGAMVRRTTRRWPAAVVLVCAAPMAQLVLRFDMLRAALHFLAPVVMLALGSIGTLAVGLIILVTPQPTPRDPIARAVAQSRSSE